MEIKEKLKNNSVIIVVLLLAIVLHIIAMIQLTPSYNIVSDDLAFIESGIAFKETGKVTMHNVVSAKNMPGMTILISIFVLLFGNSTQLFWIFIKLFWIFMGITSIYGIYKIIRIFSNATISAVMCCLFLVPDFIYMNNLILTETPYMLCNIFLIYSSLQLGKTKKAKYFWYILIWYILGLFIRPTIALFPIILLIYLILKKYDWKILLKQGAIAMGILLVLLIPWWYRNYKVFGRFIPLTYGTGNPLLLGTYQGYGYPTDNELDYAELDSSLPEKLITVVKDQNSEYTSEKQIAAFDYDEAKAKFRIKKWFESNPISLLKSYLIFKPKGLIYCSFYWKEIFGVSISTILFTRKAEIIVFMLLTILTVVFRKRWREILFILSAYMYQIVLYSYTFSFERYGQPIIFHRYIIIGWMIYEIYQWIKLKYQRRSNASINNNANT